MRKGYVFLALLVVVAAFGFSKMSPWAPPEADGVSLIVMENCGGCVPPAPLEDVREVVEDEIGRGMFSAEGLPGFSLLADITGIVYDEEGRPLPGAEVVLYGTKDGSQRAFELRQNADMEGRYAFSAYTKDPGQVKRLLIGIYANTQGALNLLIPPGKIPMQYGSGPYELPSGTNEENVQVDRAGVEGSVHTYNAVVENSGINVELDDYYTELEYPEGMIIAGGIGMIPENLIPAAKKIDWVFKKDVKYSGDMVGGLYFENKSIYVSMETDPYVALHELGHHIEFLTLTQACYSKGEREGMEEEHNRLFNNRMGERDTFCCTGQFEEEFSNLFASYIVYGPEPLYRLAGGSKIKREKVKFMENFVFNDVAFECS
jgi:hypothetical protein